MGKPAPSGVGASGAPATGDQANAVVSGTIVAVGPTAPFAFLGSFNVLIWGSVVATLTTTNASGSASVNSGTGIVAGQTVNSVNVPAGTTWATFSGTSGTLAFPPGHTNAEVVTGVDAAAIFMSAVWSASIQLERSFDGGSTWLICGVGGGGQGAQYTGANQAGVPVSLVPSEPERMVLYRLNCTVYASGTINYRISTTGAAATAWGIPPS